MAPHDTDFSRLTVLVVDDERFVRRVLLQQLHALGVGTVLESSDGKEAIEVLRQLIPDIVFCDIRMGPVDGLEVLKYIRTGQGGTNPGVPLVFITGTSDRETVLAAKQFEVDGYLIKPVAANDLKAKITAVLTKRRSREDKAD